jgi:hypothetical protein
MAGRGISRSIARAGGGALSWRRNVLASARQRGQRAGSVRLRDRKNRASVPAMT